MAREIINNFLPQYKLHECVDKSHDRLSFIHFENGYAYASDGHIAVRAKINVISNFDDFDIAKLDGKSIGYKEFKSMLDYDEVEVEDTGIRVCSDKTNIFFGFNRQQGFKFPGVEDIFDDALSKLGKGQSVDAIGIDAKQLSRLSNAMALNKLRFDFYGNKGSILVRSINLEIEDYIVGIIMPIVVDD